MADVAVEGGDVAQEGPEEGGVVPDTVQNTSSLPKHRRRDRERNSGMVRDTSYNMTHREANLTLQIVTHVQSNTSVPGRDRLSLC